jgi:hypothetical protein
MCHCGNALRVKLQHSQSIDVFLAKMFEQIRLMDPCKQVSPDRVLVIRKNDLLILNSIFKRWVKMLLDDIPCVNWLVLILGHNFAPFSYKEMVTQNIDKIYKEMLSPTKTSVKNGTCLIQ